MSLAQWTAVAQGIFTILLMVVGVFFARARAEQVGREELLKSLSELREQIGDRDRTALGLREELKSLDQQLKLLTERIRTQEAQILALVTENLGLKALAESNRMAPRRKAQPQAKPKPKP